MPDLALEGALPAPVCGIDEVGRGPWAGPVTAAAVILVPGRVDAALIAALDDSKKLSALRRDELAARLHASPGVAIGLGHAGVAEIDEFNILAATMLAMQRAVAALDATPNFALVDGNRCPDLPCPARAVIGGDALSASIAAASIVAKVNRDRAMAALAATCPGYGWETNAGYGTPQHRDGLERLGVTPHHRRSFAPIRKMLSPATPDP